MVSLQSQPTLDLFQFVFRLFHNLKQNVYQWEGWGGIAEPPCFNRGDVAHPSRACGSKQSIISLCDDK